MSTRPEVTASIDNGLETLSVVLPEYPGLTWTMAVHYSNKEPYFTRLGFEPTDPQRHLVIIGIPVHLPVARLLGIWRVFHNLNQDGTDLPGEGNLWEALWPTASTFLSRAPRRNKTTIETDHDHAMTRWSEPIAETMLAAYSAGEPLQQTVARRFGFSTDRAKQVIETARKYHPYLPKQPRPADPPSTQSKTARPKKKSDKEMTISTERKNK